MRICIPLTPADNLKDPKTGQRAAGSNVKDLVELQVKVLTKFGGLDQHQILIVPTPSLLPLGNAFADALRGACPNTKCVCLTNGQMPFEPQDVWPVGANNHFANTFLHAVAHEAEVMPTLWYEMDSFPTQEGWVDRLAVAYQNSRETFFGCVKEMGFIDDAGNPRMQAGDDYMLGVAVYPPEFGADMNTPMNTDMSEQACRLRVLCQIKHDLETLALPGRPGEGSRSIGEAFDIYLRTSLKRGGRAATGLIADQWNTYNYRLDDEGQLVCDAGPDRPNSRQRGGIVDPEAVLIHGCKDGTGHRLAAEGKIAKRVWRNNTPQARLLALEPAVSSVGLEGMLAMMIENQKKSDERIAAAEERMAKILENMTAGKPSVIPAPVSTREAMKASEASFAQKISKVSRTYDLPPVHDTSEIIKRSLSFLASGQTTVKRIADRMKEGDAPITITSAELRPILEARTDLFEVKTGPAGWVSLKQAEVMAERLS